MPRCAECKAPTCWTERTKLEKCLILSLILTGAFALAITSAYLAAILIINKDKDTKEMKMPNPDKVCETPSCIFAAEKILESMDPKISPCENFYEFACGNFLKKKIIPEDKRSIDILGKLNDKVIEEMKVMLEEPLQKGEPKAFQLMKKFYKTCMDTDAIEKNGFNTIRSILKDLGGWPLLEGPNWVESKFDWRELSYKFQNIGYVDNPLFQVFVTYHLTNSSRRIIYITDSEETISKSFRRRLWTGEEKGNAYFQFMVDVSVLLGADVNKSLNEIIDILGFQSKLLNLKNQKDDDGEEMSINQLQNKIPNISWLDYLNKLLAPHVKLRGEEAVFVFKQEYLKNLGSLLPTVPKRILANYMIWDFLYFSTTYSYKALREARFKFKKSLDGVATPPPRWSYCVQDFMNGDESIDRESLYIGVGALFIRKYFNNKTKQDAHEMILNIRHAVQDTLEHTDWMDAKTKEHALDKLKAMIISTAYPEEFLDDKKLEEFYADLDLEDDNYLKSFLKLNQFDIRNHYRRLRKPIDRNDWILRGIPVGTANAHYDPLKNGINVPAATLQDTMFDINRPLYLNYGAIGFIIGHEFTHGFDTKGSKHDKYGNEVDWWAPETKNKFLKRSQCFVEQYNKYVVPDLNLTVNGSVTLQENIADNGGIAVTYKAYHEMIKKQGVDKTLPSLNYTQNQLFWIVMANSWCSKSTIKLQQYLLNKDTHSPARFRIIGIVSNSKDFSKDFRCSSKSKMNPKYKCKLW